MGNDSKLVRDERVDPDEVQHVKLGQHIYEVVPQPIGYLRSQMGVFAQTLGGQDVSGANIASFLAGRAHELLSVFIPDLMPIWEFEGYGSPSAAEREEYEQEADRSPNAAQIDTAFRVCFKVNRVNALQHLFKLVDPTLLQAVVSKWVADAVDTLPTTSSPTDSAPPTDGEPLEPSSMPVVPTSDPELGPDTPAVSASAAATQA